MAELRIRCSDVLVWRGGSVKVVGRGIPDIIIRAGGLLRFGDGRVWRGERCRRWGAGVRRFRGVGFGKDFMRGGEWKLIHGFPHLRVWRYVTYRLLVIAWKIEWFIGEDGQV